MEFVPCRLADASTLPAENASFDAIVTTSTLEHIPTDVIRAIMKECHRVLRPQGLMPTSLIILTITRMPMQYQ